MSALLWALALVLVASLVLQGVVLRRAYRRNAALQQARHLQLQEAMNGKFEKTKRQIGRLQLELTAARRQLQRLAQHSPAVVAASVPARQRLERELDEAAASRFSQPADEFADTQPAPMVTQHGSLLFQ